MDAKPLVSIIINNYNYARFLSEAIDSSLAQTYPHTEVIVVDDGSTDNSKDVINSYGNQIIKIFKENGGQASALNAGFTASKGEIICLLDADDMCLPEKVSEVVNLFRSNPSIDWVFHESAQITTEDLANIGIKAIDDDISQKNHHFSSKNIDFQANILNAELPSFTPSTSNLCFSKRILNKIFPLPEIRGFSGYAINDFYIKYLAVGLSTGCVTSKNLGIFRLHNNTYSNPAISINKKRLLYAELHMTAAYWMQVNFPVFSKLSKKLFSKGLASYLKCRNKEFNYDCLIKDYLNTVSYLDIFEISWKTFYYFIKLNFVRVV